MGEQCLKVWSGLVDLLSSALLLSLWVEPGVEALWSRHARVERHHVSSTELAGADPRAPAPLSASPGGPQRAPRVQGVRSVTYSNTGTGRCWDAGVELKCV